MFQGKNAGEFFNIMDASSIPKAFGWDLAGSGEAIIWFYTGNMNNFSRDSFNDNRFEIEGGVSLFMDINVGLIIGKTDKYGGRLVGIKGSAGGGFSPFYGYSLSINWRQTTTGRIGL